MIISNYTSREASWQVGLSATSRDDVFKEMLRAIYTPEFQQANPELTQVEILQALLDRETMRSTATGSLIAFPHARLPQLNRALFAVGTLSQPVLFENEPVRMVCLILVPTSDPSLSLKMMAQLSRMFMDSKVQTQILDAQTPEALRAIFNEYNPRIDKSILAADIMQPPRFSVRVTDRISVCTHLMSVNHLQAVPVLNDQREIVGEITVDRLFNYGLPEFFSQLKSVSFIADFDPFEKYFKEERNLLAGDVMLPNAHVIPGNHTILEIVFDLTVRSHLMLYVVDEEGRWVGTIGKGTVLDNVINY